MEPVRVIQGPHCLIDTRIDRALDADSALRLLSTLAGSLAMKPLGKPRVVTSGPSKLTAYQIISTSHIIIHAHGHMFHADLFSCEPFDVDRCVSELVHDLPGAELETSCIQYCQRNLLTAPGETPSIPMANLNALTSNPATLTHAMVNWYSGDEERLGDAELGRKILTQALGHLSGCENVGAGIDVLGVDPVESSWDLGGISGGYVDIQRQLTIHTFAGLNGAYTDVMAHTFDLESIIDILRDGFGFSYCEVDCIFQRER